MGVSLYIIRGVSTYWWGSLYVFVGVSLRIGRGVSMYVVGVSLYIGRGISECW